MLNRVGIQRFPCRGLLVAAGLLAASAVTGRCQVPVLTVCEALSNRGLHNGNPVIIVGRYFAYEEGAYLNAECKPKVIADGRDWQNSIWLGNDPARVAPPPANAPQFDGYAQKIFSNLPDAQPQKWKMVQGCSYFPGTWAAIYGRFETKTPFPLVRGEPIGFGHLGMYVAQLAYPASGKWCLLPAQGYREYVALEKKRQEDAKAALWREIKIALESPGGPDYAGGLDFFETNMKGRLLPLMKGTVISVDFAPSGPVIMLAISNRTTPEVRLQLHHPLGRAVVAGTDVEFKGAATGCTLKPFLLTMEAAPEDLQIVGQETSVRKP